MSFSKPIEHTNEPFISNTTPGNITLKTNVDGSENPKYVDLLDEDKDIDKEYRYKKLPHYVYKTERKKGDRKFRFNRLELVT